MICNWFMHIIVPMILRGDVIAETARRRPRSRSCTCGGEPPATRTESPNRKASLVRGKQRHKALLFLAPVNRTEVAKHLTWESIPHRRRGSRSALLLSVTFRLEGTLPLMDALRASIDAEKKKAPAPSTEARRPAKRKASQK
jgi:hypothetical protein